jgi:23S rRNA pseudouridine1911/1915/1917 synthase
MTRRDPPLSFPLIFTLPEEAGFMRLDAALSLRLPHLPVRARRRLWTWLTVRVNGVPAAPGVQVGPGDTVRLEPAKPAGIGLATIPDVTLVGMNEAFAVFAKPAGLHSAAVAGGGETSLEALLPEIWPRLRAEAARPASPAGSCPWLLTRLDKGTSGLVLAAQSREAEQRFRAAERAGLVRKSYLAVVRGKLDRPLRLDAGLRTAGGRLTRVCATPDPDPARHSLVEPLFAVRAARGTVALSAGNAEATLVRVDIGRGARHQIRAHLAHAGFPLLGETRYAPALHDAPALSGAEAQGADAPLYLHHARLQAPGLYAVCPAPWRGKEPSAGGGTGRHFSENAPDAARTVRELALDSVLGQQFSL